MSYTNEQIILAAISMTSSNSPAEMECKKSADGDCNVSYIRASDAQKFSYDCKIEGDQVRWFGKDIGGWNEGNRVYFKASDDCLIMELHNHGNLVSEKVFKQIDF